MGAAAYVGRVGGLAVALGVGTAIATGHGVAAAETGDSTSSNTDSSVTGSAEDTGSATTITGATSTSTNPAGSGDTDTTTQTTTQTTTTGGGDSDSPSTNSDTVAGGVVVSAQTNTGSSAPDIPAAEASPTEDVEEPDTVPPAETSGDPAPSEEPAPVGEDGRSDPTPAASAAPTTKQPEPSTTGSPVSNDHAGATGSTATAVTRTADATGDPAEPATPTDPIAQFVSAQQLAAASPTLVSPAVAAQAVVSQTTPDPAPTATPPDPIQAVVSVVTGVIDWVLHPFVGGTPVGPAQPPLAWGLLAWVRRELDNVLAAFGQHAPAGPTTSQPVTTVALTADQVASLGLTPEQFASLGLVADPTAQAAATVNVPAFPTPGQQLSPSTEFVNWVSGNYQTGDPLIADTLKRFGISGTDLGIIWDNGMTDDPNTPYDEHQVLIAFGDTFGLRSVPGEDWRFNTLFRSSDQNLADGMQVPNGEFGNGNMFGGAPLWPNPRPSVYDQYARQIISAPGLPTGITLIPTAGISVPTPDTQFGVTQYVSFMSVTNWGSPGYWSTNYAAIASSTDNGENWKVAPKSVRYNQSWSGNQNFQQSAFVQGNDGYIYMYGTPSGRQGAAYVSRVKPQDIVDTSKYEYYSKGQSWFFWSTPAGWYKNDPSKATAVFGNDTGACGVAKAGNHVSEMSAQYNQELGKYVVLYGDQFNNIVMRTSDSPVTGWSSAKVLMTQQNGGIYAPMMHPWSPSTQGTGTDLYWNLSLWSQYNVMLMRTDLTKV